MTLRGLAHRAWADLPFWFLWWTPFAILNTEINLRDSPMIPAVFAFLVPFSVLTLAWRGAPGPRKRWGAYFAGSGLLLLLILGGLTGASMTQQSLLRIFEISALAQFAVLGLHAGLVEGRRVLSLIFGVGLIYGLILENLGVGMGFFVERSYGLTFPGLPAPLATALGWCSVWYSLWWVSPWLAGEAAEHRHRARVAVGLALAIDLQLDPVATAAGFWAWNPELAPAVRGVPILNFNAWAAAVWPFARSLFQAAAVDVPAARLLLRLPLVLLQALGILVVLTLLTEAGTGWPTLRLLVMAGSDLLGALAGLSPAACR